MEAATTIENQDSILAKNLINCLFVLFRTAYIHDQKNASLLPPLKNIDTVVQKTLEYLNETKFVLRVVGSTFFLNAMLVKLDQSAFQNGEFLQIICEDIGIGEFEFQQGCTEEDYRLLMRTVVGAVRAGGDTPAEMQRKLGPINLNPPVTIGTGKGRALLDRRQYVLRTYAVSLMFCNNMIEQWQKGKPPRLAEVKRLSQSLLDLVSEQGATLLGLTQLKAYRKYVANHFVNVAIIAQVMGEAVGLKKEELVQLGMTGLLHELGAMDLPQQMIDRIDALSESENAVLAKLPFFSILRLLELKAVGDQGIARLISVFENAGHMQVSKYRAERTSDIFAQILTVADAYDHLSTSRMGHRALRPDQALEVLLVNRDKKFAGWAVKALAEGIGRYPIGTMVELTSGERAIVIDRPQGDASADRPRVRVIAGPEGEPVDAGLIVDLSVASAEGTSRSIRRTLDPDAAKVNVAHFFVD